MAIYILLQAWSLPLPNNVTEVSCPICISGLLLIDGVRPLRLLMDWFLLDEISDMVVAFCPWQVLQRERCGLMQSKYLKTVIKILL